MQLKEKKWQNRRDFEGIYECESCGHEEEHSGYDDRNFHDNVTPRWQCKKCGKSSLDVRETPAFVQTKYADNEHV